MENAVFIGLSRQMAMRRQMDIIANNLANMNTTSYRGESVLFEEYLMPTGGNRKSSFVLDWGVLRSTKEGPVQTTGNPLDVAVTGPGYLVVDAPAGRRYSRNGHLRLNEAGQLSTVEGYPVLDTGNQPIRLDPRDGQVTISRDGSISNANGQVGRLSLVEFRNEQSLRKAGDNLYSSDEPEQPAAVSEIVQGAIEGSNVEPIVEMTKMVELMRGYQGVQRMLESEQELQRRMIERLGKVA